MMEESGLALDNRRADALARKRGQLGSASTVILIGSLHIVYYIALGVSGCHAAGLLRRTETDTGQAGVSSVHHGDNETSGPPSPV
jgi:hypothetical protein